MSDAITSALAAVKDMKPSSRALSRAPSQNFAKVEKLPAVCEKCHSLAILNIENKCEACVRADYSRLRHEREIATFAMTMRMDPAALAGIRKEFFARSDEVTLEEFIYIIEKHLNKSDKQETPQEHMEFVANMTELFKDIDVNGDGMMEWSEFTIFTVEKANILNKKMKFTAIANYHDSTEKLDPSSQHRHRHDFAQAIPIKTLHQFAILEDNKNSIFIFNSMNGKLVKTIITDAVPQAIIHVVKHDLLVSACVDMTMTTHSLDDPNPNKRYKLQSAWATPGIQMALAYVENKDVLYSGGANGNIYAWDIKQRELLATINAHADIVMKLLVLRKLNTLVSASLDTTIGIWDVYTHTRIMKLEGHKKGVFNIDYNAEYRLLFSCGFDHDVCVWSPFVSTMIYRLKGHHATLVGVHCVEGTNEIITADAAGVFKLWDVTKFQCLQTFFAGNSQTESSIGAITTLNCFFHVRLPNAQQGEDDSRIFAASKTIYSFDQGRVVHEATTDFSTVQWAHWIDSSSAIITVSETNLILWDALMGSKTSTHKLICGNEISAVCLDNRLRKIVLGDVLGNIGVYNPLNGALMKSIVNDVNCAVVALMYVATGDTRRFIAGFANGLIRVYNEDSLEDCGLIRSFDTSYSYTELTRLCFNMIDLSGANPGYAANGSVACTGAASTTVKLWDYETGKADQDDLVVCSAPEYVMYIGYLDPLPILVTGDSFGNVLLWGSNTSKWVHARLAGFLNITPPSAEWEPQKRTVDTDQHDEYLRQFPATEDQYSTYLKTSVAGKTINGMHDLSSPTMRHASFSSRSSNKRTSVVAVDASHPCGSPHGNAEENSAELLVEKEYAELAIDICEESAVKWGKVAPTEAISWDAENCWLYTGDEQGYLRKWDLSDLMYELDSQAMMKGQTPMLKNTLCMRPRDQHSALVPVFHTVTVGQNVASKFLVGRKSSVSNLGINFVWCVSAHHDRVVYASATPHGVITSATDKLVKMWTQDGRPAGVLLQSVPMGVRSRGWDLSLDIEGILKREQEEMEEIMSRVSVCANDPDKPDLAVVDFTGMEPGKGSAPFNRSALRQRIHKTNHILGLNFKVEDGPTNAYADDASVSSNAWDCSSNVSLAGTESVSSSVVSKTLRQALVELKSTELAADMSIKHHLLSDVQQRRKEAKISAVAKKYEVNRKYKLPPIQKPNEDGNADESTSPAFDIGDDKLKDYLFTPRKAKKETALTLTRKNSCVTTKSSPKKVAKSTMVIQRPSTITQKCSKYDTYSDLEQKLNMDTAKPISPRTIKINRDANTELKNYYKPLSLRIPSMQMLFSGQKYPDSVPSISTQGTPRSCPAPGTLSRGDSTDNFHDTS